MNFYERLTTLYNNVQIYGIKSEHCWELMTIAEEMRLQSETLRTFKHDFNWWGGYENIWQPLYVECIDAIGVF